MYIEQEFYGVVSATPKLMVYTLYQRAVSQCELSHKLATTFHFGYARFMNTLENRIRARVFKGIYRSCTATNRLVLLQGLPCL